MQSRSEPKQNYSSNLPSVASVVVYLMRPNLPYSSTITIMAFRPYNQILYRILP
jgi:hypothetical protein